ncbi:MAG: hypothetical protein AB1583_06365 [Bacteroidota bacterium]
MKPDVPKWVIPAFRFPGKWLVLCFFLLYALTLKAQQEKLDYRTTDSLTLKYYLTGEWDSLIRVGKASGLDYYWLNARMGYAWYAKGKYGRALRYFKKALINNDADPFSLEFYAYSSMSLGFSEQTSAAIGSIIQSNPERLYPLSPYPQSGAGGGFLQSTASSVLNPSEIDKEKNIYGEAALPGSGPYFYGYGSLALSPKLIITPGFSYLKTHNPFRAAKADTLLFSADNNYHETNLHLTMTWVPRLCWTVQSHFRLSGMNYEFSTVSYNPAHNSFSLATNKRKITDYAGGLKLTHYFGDLVISTDASWHSEYDSSFTQAGINLYYYPFSDSRLIYGAGLYATFHNNNAGIAVNQSLSLNLLKNLWLTGAFTLGNIEHKSFADGWITYNADFKISRTTSLSILFNLNQSISASVQWTNLKCKGQRIYYSTFTDTMFQDFAYHKNSLSLSIYWKW